MRPRLFAVLVFSALALWGAYIVTQGGWRRVMGVILFVLSVGAVVGYIVEGRRKGVFRSKSSSSRSETQRRPLRNRHYEFLTGVKGVAFVVSGPARSDFVDSYLVGSLVASGRGIVGVRRAGWCIARR